MKLWRAFFSGFDGLLFLAMLGLTFFGLVTMYSHVGDNEYFNRQLIWIGVAVGFFFMALIPDYRFLRAGNTTFYLYLGVFASLVLVLFVGEEVLGAKSRFDFGFFSLQAADPAKLVLIILLAKYFAKRHELIGDIKHTIISGLYTFGFSFCFFCSLTLDQR